MASRLDDMKQELVAAVHYGQDFDFKIEAGDYISREDVSAREHQLKTSWLEERSELQVYFRFTVLAKMPHSIVWTS